METCLCPKISVRYITSVAIYPRVSKSYTHQKHTNYTYIYIYFISVGTVATFQLVISLHLICFHLSVFKA